MESYDEEDDFGSYKEDGTTGDDHEGEREKDGRQGEETRSRAYPALQDPPVEEDRPAYQGYGHKAHPGSICADGRIFRGRLPRE